MLNTIEHGSQKDTILASWSLFSLRLHATNQNSSAREQNLCNWMKKSRTVFLIKAKQDFFDAVFNFFKVNLFQTIYNIFHKSSDIFKNRFQKFEVEKEKLSATKNRIWMKKNFQSCFKSGNTTEKVIIVWTRLKLVLAMWPDL